VESWSFTISHIAAFIAGIALTGYLFRALWRKVSMPAQTQTLPVTLWIALFIGIYFIALAAGIGIWLDGQDPGGFPWGLAMLLISIAAVGICAFYWIRKRMNSLKIKRALKRTSKV